MNFFKRMFQSRQPAGAESQQSIDEELKAWKIFTIENPDQGGLAATVRLRIEKPPLPPGRRFDTAIEIVWAYGEGLPSPEVNARQVELDLAIDELTGMNGYSEIVSVKTGLGEKVWCFYSSDRDRFMREFNRALTTHKPYPIEIKFYDDPEWGLWSQLKADLEQPGN